MSYSKAEGFGASVTAKTSYANASASFTQKSGLTVSVSKQMSTSLGDGFKASGNAEVSYNTKTGFSASAGMTLTSTSPEYKDGKFTESDNGSISGNAKIDRTGATGSTSVNTGANLDIASNLSSMESSLDTMAQENRDFNSRMAMNKYYDKYRDVNPGLANMSNEEIADLKKDLAKNQGVYTDIADGTSRESFGAELLGSLSDIGNMVTGDSRGGNQTGYIDEKGNYHQRTCFVKGTLVRTREGFVPIEKLKIGDEVLSLNEKTGKIDSHKITETFIHDVKLIYRLTYENGSVVETTWNHPFYVRGRGWVEVKDLFTKDRSVTMSSVKNSQEQQITVAASLNNGTLSDIATAPANASAEQAWAEEMRGTLGIAKIEQIRRADKVYNIEVEGDHTYFVTKDGVLVHNYPLTGMNPGLGETLLDLGKKVVNGVTSFLNPKVDPKNEAKIAELDSTLQKPARNFIRSAASEDINLRITQGYRSNEEQDELYAQGRTKPGGIVTKAQGGQSYHNYKLAIDVVEIDSKGKPIWDNPNWDKIGQLGKKSGFEWGGDWKSFKDKPHFQITDGKSTKDLKKEKQGKVEK